jgi:hypothetical protein
MKKSVVFCILILFALVFVLAASNARAYEVDKLKAAIKGSMQEDDVTYDWINTNFNVEYPSEQRAGEIANAEYYNCVAPCPSGFICYYDHSGCGKVPENYLNIPMSWCNPETCTLAEQSYYFPSLPPTKADVNALCRTAKNRIEPYQCRTFQGYATGNAIYCIVKPRTSETCIAQKFVGNSRDILANLAGHCIGAAGCMPDITTVDNDNDGLPAYSATAYDLAPSGVVYTDNKENKYSLKDGTPTNPRTVRWGDCLDNNAKNVQGLNLDDATDARVGFPLSYITETNNTRKFIPSLPVNPFDDIALIFTFPSPKDCPFLFNGFGNPVVELSVNENVLWNYTNLETEEVVDLGRNQIMESLIIRGWSNGRSGIIPDANKMEQLVDAISKNKDIVFTVKNAEGWKYVWNSETNTRETQGNEIFQRVKQIKTKMTNCVQMFGSGEHRIINVRHNDTLQDRYGVRFKIFQSVEGVIPGFKITDPFAKYQDSFSHYIDLKTPTLQSVWDIGVKLPTNNSCGKSSPLNDDTTFAVFSAKQVEDAGGFAVGGFLVISSLTSPDTYVYLHEFGHAFGYLDDEYLYPDDRGPWLGLTCRNNSNAFSPDPSYLGCSDMKHYRSTLLGTIMGNIRTENKFSVLCCSYIMVKIKGGNYTDYTAECNAMDTIKPKDECLLYDYECHAPVVTITNWGTYADRLSGVGCYTCKNRKCVSVEQRDNILCRQFDDPRYGGTIYAKCSWAPIQTDPPVGVPHCLLNVRGP